MRHGHIDGFRYIEPDVQRRKFRLYKSDTNDALFKNTGGMLMLTSIGLPQFAVIVVVLIVFIIYTQRHRF